MVETKEVHIVDGCLRINPVVIPIADWEAGFFGTQIGDQPIVALRGGWNEITTYGAFETKEEAEKFRDEVQMQKWNS